MKNNKLHKNASILVAALTLASITSFAHAGESANWLDSSGSPIRNSSGECWRSASWTPSTAAADCDGAIVVQAAVPATIAIKVTQNTPAPILYVAPTPVEDALKVSALDVTFLDFEATAHFAHNKFNLSVSEQRNIDALVNSVRETELILIEVTGHTDSTGGAQYNQQLSQQRADSVQAYLAEKGIEKHLIHTRAMGESMPSADNGVAGGRADNRRVVIKVQGSVDDQFKRTLINAPHL